MSRQTTSQENVLQFCDFCDTFLPYFVVGDRWPLPLAKELIQHMVQQMKKIQIV